VSNFTETEVKLYVPDLEAVARRLQEVKARLKTARVHEVNVRYDTDAMKLSRGQKVLRLRRDNRVRLTVKDERGEPNASGVSSRYEAEVEVSDFDEMEAILEKLGYRPYMTYEKYRTTYELEGAEVTLDEMPFGSFVEIEGDVDAIEQALELLQLQEATRFGEGYILLFENVKRNLGLQMQDLVFENFKGIDVPQSAFEGWSTGAQS
jgi:adenylate cyclase class 2